MSHAELCPVCKGSGKVSGNGETGSSVITVTCHGCDGKGWVTVQDSAEQQIIPYYVPVTYPVAPTNPYWPPYITYCKNYETTGGRQHLGG